MKEVLHNVGIPDNKSPETVAGDSSIRRLLITRRGIGLHHGWKTDIQIPAELSVEQYFAMFKALRGSRLRRVIDVALGFNPIREQDP
jgi:hypothetical protein